MSCSGDDTTTALTPLPNLETPTITDFSISYSFGGSRERPLISRRIEFHVPKSPETDHQLQEILLERADVIINDLCHVYDEAMTKLVHSNYTDKKQVDILMGASAYCVNNILVQSPSTKYALMYSRVQDLLNCRSHLTKTMGPSCVDIISGFVLQTWETLRQIDSSFAGDMLKQKQLDIPLSAE